MAQREDTHETSTSSDTDTRSSDTESSPGEVQDSLCDSSTIGSKDESASNDPSPEEREDGDSSEIEDHNQYHI